MMHKKKHQTKKHKSKPHNIFLTPESETYQGSYDRITELESLLAEKESKVFQLELEIKILNENYRQEVLKKADKAQRLLDEKIAEYQKKYEQELMHAKKYALKAYALDLIQIINDFETAVSFESSDPKINNFLVGFKMFSKMFQNYLKTNHIIPIMVQVGDCFDPQCMEAVESVAHDTYTQNQIVKVIKSGYYLHDVVLVPTKVIVAK